MILLICYPRKADSVIVNCFNHVNYDIFGNAGVPMQNILQSAPETEIRWIFSGLLHKTNPSIFPLLAHV